MPRLPYGAPLFAPEINPSVSSSPLPSPCLFLARGLARPKMCVGGAFGLLFALSRRSSAISSHQHCSHESAFHRPKQRVRPRINNASERTRKQRFASPICATIHQNSNVEGRRRVETNHRIPCGRLRDTRNSHHTHRNHLHMALPFGSTGRRLVSRGTGI